MGVNDVTERELAEARQRNADRRKTPKVKPLARWMRETSPAQVRRMIERDGPLAPIPGRLSAALDAPIVNEREYSYTGSRKDLKKYGLTDRTWRELVDRHDSRCAICGKHERFPSALAVDHCHGSGRVRGLLCRRCNTGLGQFRDNPELLAKAMAYLRARSSS